MAFSKAPSQSTYQTKDVKTLWALNNRDADSDKDTMAVNGFFDPFMDKILGDKSFAFVKRDGSSKYPYTVPSGSIRGMFYWEDANKLLVAYGDKIDVLTATTGAVLATVTAFLTTTGTVGFTEFYYDTGDTKIVAGDGSRLVTIDSANTLVVGADVDQPSSFDPNIVFLDGYLFLLKTGTNDIYNSDLNDPLAFTSGDFLSAEMSSDKLVRLEKLNNYILAFGTSSVEYFFDAANTSGSPLQRNDTFVKNVGYLGGMAKHGSKLYFIGKTSKTGPELFVAEDAKMDSKPLPIISRFLQPSGTIHAAVVQNGGHQFYSLSERSKTYWMDLDTGVWTQAAFQNTTNCAIKEAVMVLFSDGWASLFSLDGSLSLYQFKPTLYRDDGVDFTVTTQTQKQMFDTMHEKFMSRLLVVGDRYLGSLLSISWTDDDYQTFSTPRTVDMSLERPVLHRLGRFLQRAFKMVFTQNAPLRVEHFEVDFNIGNR